MDWYRNQENGNLEWIDVTQNEDKTDESYKYQKGYDYVAGADATIKGIKDTYNFLQGDDAFGYSQYSQVWSYKAKQQIKAFNETLEGIPDKMHQADLALQDLARSVNSTELGFSGRLGVKSAYLSVKTGIYSTGENTGGVFFSLSGNLDFNNISIQDFGSFDYSSESYLSLQTNKGIKNIPLKTSVRLGYFQGTVSSNGKIKIGVGFGKPGYSANVGFLREKNNRLEKF